MRTVHPIINLYSAGRPQRDRGLCELRRVNQYRFSARCKWMMGFRFKALLSIDLFIYELWKIEVKGKNWGIWADFHTLLRCYMWMWLTQQPLFCPFRWKQFFNDEQFYSDALHIKFITIITYRQMRSQSSRYSYE